MEKETDQMYEALVPEQAWASWDFRPSPWNAGTLLVNCLDDRRAPFFGFAPPGVSLHGESGFETARWRYAAWKNVEAFLSHHEPEWVRAMEFDSVCGEIPPDFVDWAASATAAHIERLRALADRRPGQTSAADCADLLHAEMEMALPGTLERINEEFDEELLVRSVGPAAQAGRVRIWTPTSIQVDRRQVLDIGVQATVVLAAYLIYRLLREPWAPKGAETNLAGALKMPVGDFVAWLYGIGHVVVPVAFLAWVYLRRPRSFVLVRDTLGAAAALAVAAYLLYSPKRVYAEGSAHSIPSGALATMPALHLVVALGLAGFGTLLSRTLIARVFWLTYPVIVALILIDSGSRYPGATIAVASLLLACSLLLARLAFPRVWSLLTEVVRSRGDLSRSRQRGPAQVPPSTSSTS